MRVLAAMSGGVDSAVAAARAVELGHEVIGVHLALSRMPGTLRTGSRGCCTIEDSMDAQRAANKLGIPFYVWDFSERFKLDVVDDFIAEYQAGRTPNPCMRCNERIKFAALLERGLSLGFDAVCTGHYASIVDDGAGNLELHRSLAMAKDQSYVLGVLNAKQLEHSMFPLGATASKDLIRQEARDRGLSVANKPDSYDICFIPEGDTRDWLKDFVPTDPGKIVDTEGNELGEHDGHVGDGELHRGAEHESRQLYFADVDFRRGGRGVPEANLRRAPRHGHEDLRWNDGGGADLFELCGFWVDNRGKRYRESKRRLLRHCFRR